MVIVTHEDEVAAHCQRVVRLRDGRVLSEEIVSRITDYAQKEGHESAFN